MKAVVYKAPKSYSVEDIETPHPGQGEVRIRTLTVGVCGTDEHVHLGEFGATYPLVPGHEIVGVVDELGAGVEGIVLGERVAVDNTIYCLNCDNCKRGKFGFCLNLKALGINAFGGFAEHCIVRSEKCYSIGDLDLTTAALVEPTACVIHGLDVLSLKPGSDVLIIGAGPTSQILCQLLADGGASQVTVAAPTQFKLDTALENGANNIVRLNRDDFGAAYGSFRELAPYGFDYVVEATGARGVLAQALPLVRDGGTLMIYGMAREADQIEVSPYDIFRREITIKGSFAQAYCFDRAIRFLQAGKINASNIITHHFSLDSYADALDALRAPSCLKAVIDL